MKTKYFLLESYTFFFLREESYTFISIRPNFCIYFPLSMCVYILQFLFGSKRVHFGRWQNNTYLFHSSLVRDRVEHLLCMHGSCMTHLNKGMEKEIAFHFLSITRFLIIVGSVTPAYMSTLSSCMVALESHH